jgi:hypothetical protein
MLVDSHEGLAQIASGKEQHQRLFYIDDGGGDL